MRPDDSVRRAASIMRRHAVRRLPVIDDGSLVGMVALADPARRTDEHRQSAALEGVSQVTQTETDVP